MRNKILIIGGIVFLVLLFFIYYLVKNNFQSTQGPKKDTPIPTGIESSFQTPLSLDERRRIANRLNDNYFQFSSEEQNSLGKFNSLLPVNNASFEIGYSDLLNKYFIKNKSGDIEQLSDFLEENGLLDIYNSEPSLFTITDQDIPTLIQQQENDFLEVIEIEENDSVNESENNTTISREEEQKLKLFTDFAKSFLSFDLKEIDIDEVIDSLSENEETDSTSPTDIAGITYPPNLGQPNSLGYYQMPLPQNNNYVFSAPTCRSQHYGSRTLIGVLYTVALAWKEKYPDSRLRIGDLNATGHLSHSNGVDVDITVTDGSAARIGAPTQKSIDLGKMFIDTGALELIIFAASSSNSQGVAVRSAWQQYANSQKIPFRSYAYTGHDDHFHVRLLPKFKGPYHKPGC